MERKSLVGAALRAGYVCWSPLGMNASGSGSDLGGREAEGEGRRLTQIRVIL